MKDIGTEVSIFLWKTFKSYKCYGTTITVMTFIGGGYEYSNK